MSRTRRNRPPDRPPYSTRDGSIRPGDNLNADDFAKTVQRRDRRERDAEADRIARGAVDAEDTPVTPKPRRRWAFWRRW